MNKSGKRIVKSFDSAASRYDAAATLQKQVAAELVSFVSDATPQTILDIGCGTGLATVCVNEAWPEARLTALDAAPSMVAATRRKLPEVQILVGDAAQVPFLPGTFDLVLSSMIGHWLSDPVQAVEAWKEICAPRGRMAVSLPVEGSLAEWKELCREAGVIDRLWPFPKASLFSGTGLCSEVRSYPRTYESAKAFLKSMKDTGADNGNPDKPPMRPADLRRVLRCSPKPFTATYQILYLHL